MPYIKGAAKQPFDAERLFWGLALTRRRSEHKTFDKSLRAHQMKPIQYQ